MTEPRTPKEAIYDEQISPLMSKILEICKAHKIAMLSEFCLGWEEDEEDDENQLCCTSALLKDEHEPTQRILEAYDLLKPKIAPFMAFTIRTVTD